MPTTEKQCTVCLQIRSVSEFAKDKQKKDGLACRCKPCKRAADLAAYRANPDRFREKAVKYAEAHREIVRETNRRTKAKHRDKVLDAKKAYYRRMIESPEYAAKLKAHREDRKQFKAEYDRKRRIGMTPEQLARMNELSKAWNARNPEKRAAITRNVAAARRLRTQVGVSGKELAEWTSRQPKKCYWCGCDCRSSFHVDHYVPLSKGGKHELDNLVISCEHCNKRKHAKDPYVFAAQVGRLF